MNINAVIESLLIYAQEHLLLDDLDVLFARNQILEELKLSSYEQYDIDADEISELPDPYGILDQISAYAVSGGIVCEKDKNAFAAKIMNYLIKRPGEISDLFGDILESNPGKAFSWLYDYNVKSGYIKASNIIRNWEAKGTKGKIEVIIAKDDKSEKLSGYPPCEKCIENTGYHEAKTLRSVPLQLGSEEFFWHFCTTPCFPGLGYAANSLHTPLVGGIGAIERMLDFVDLAPIYFAACRENEWTREHEYYVGGGRLAPFHKAPDLRKLKSAEYPYINISEIDWYVSAFRFNCTNREKLAEFADKFIGSWRKESADNNAAISVRKVENKYFVEIILERGLKVKEENSNLNDKAPGLYEMLGIFVLPEVLDEDMKQMDIFLTKELKFNETNVPQNLKKHKDMIARMLKEIGSTKISSVEAQIDIKEEVNIICEHTLGDISPFNNSEESARDKAAFLDKAGIK